MLSSSSRARTFYIHPIKQHASGEIIGHKDPISSVKLTCEKLNPILRKDAPYKIVWLPVYVYF